MEISIYWRALFGGILIGFAGILLLVSQGKIAGISGMVGTLFRMGFSGNGWRFMFLLGLFAGGLGFNLFGYPVFKHFPGQNWSILMAAGLLVGFGTQVGSGCTSGHGVCGMGRMSLRSYLATITFILTGAITVYLVQHVIGGGQ